MIKKPQNRILIIGNFISRLKGNPRNCEDFASNLIESRWNVITTSSISGRLHRLMDMLSTVWHKRRKYRIALVDVFSGPSFIWAEAVCQLLYWLRKPFILTLHGGNLPVFAKRWPWRVRHLLRSANAVTAPSHYLLDHMKAYRQDIQLIPYGLDIQCIKFCHRRSVQPKLVWLRAFHEIYNPSLAPKVVNLLKDSFPDTTFLMIGPDKGDGSFQKVKDSASFLGVIDRFNFPGIIPKHQVPQWLAKGNIFINTTNVDNTPVSVLEAMACGLPVVSTDVGGIPYLLENDHDALLVPPCDPVAMAKAVARILTEPGLADKLSRNARRTAENYDWSVVLPQWEKLITEFINIG